MATPISLVAEPHDDTRVLYRMCLEHSGWNTLEAEDGATALSLAYSHRPQLLLTELRLPRIDGYSLINLLKRDPATAGMAIIVVTADAARTAIDGANHAGADAVFAKPADLGSVMARVEELKQRRHEVMAQSESLRGRARRVLAESARALDRATTLAGSMERYWTTSPPASPPVVSCDSCGNPLTYRRSHVGGVNARSPEQWDYYECPAGCGSFQFRHRTGKLRRV